MVDDRNDKETVERTTIVETNGGGSGGVLAIVLLIIVVLVLVHVPRRARRGAAKPKIKSPTIDSTSMKPRAGISSCSPGPNVRLTAFEISVRPA